MESQAVVKVLVALWVHQQEISKAAAVALVEGVSLELQAAVAAPLGLRL